MKWNYVLELLEVLESISDSEVTKSQMIWYSNFAKRILGDDAHSSWLCFSQTSAKQRRIWRKEEVFSKKLQTESFRQVGSRMSSKASKSSRWKEGLVVKSKESFCEETFLGLFFANKQPRKSGRKNFWIFFSYWKKRIRYRFVIWKFL